MWISGSDGYLHCNRMRVVFSRQSHGRADGDDYPGRRARSFLLEHPEMTVLWQESRSSDGLGIRFNDIVARQTRKRRLPATTITEILYRPIRTLRTFCVNGTSGMGRCRSAEGAWTDGKIGVHCRYRHNKAAMVEAGFHRGYRLSVRCNRTDSFEKALLFGGKKKLKRNDPVSMEVTLEQAKRL